jgi:hypothetical protein
MPSADGGNSAREILATLAARELIKTLFQKGFQREVSSIELPKLRYLIAVDTIPI